MEAKVGSRVSLYRMRAGERRVIARAQVAGDPPVTGQMAAQIPDIPAPPGLREALGLCAGADPAARATGTPPAAPRCG